MNYFYYDAKTDEEIPSDRPAEGNLDQVLAVWESLSQEPGTFFGVFEGDGQTVQFLWTEEGELLVDLPDPEKKGSLTCLATAEQVPPLLRQLSTGFDPRQIDGLEFEYWQ